MKRRVVCEWCGGFAGRYEIHHINYENVGCERLCDLLLVCRECHVSLHAFITQMEAKGRSREKVMQRLAPYCTRRMLKHHEFWSELGFGPMANQGDDP